VIAAALRREPTVNPSQNTARLVGSITNLGDAPLRHLWVRCADGTADLARQPGWPPAGLAPKGTFNVDAPTTRSGTNAPWTWTVDFPTNPSSSLRTIHTADEDPQRLARAAGGLSPSRSGRVAELLSSGSHDYAAVYALSDESPAAAKLPGFEPVGKHWQVVRAVVKLTP
jgi:hypothetical protein